MQAWPEWFLWLGKRHASPSGSFCPQHWSSNALWGSLLQQPDTYTGPCMHICRCVYPCMYVCCMCVLCIHMSASLMHVLCILHAIIYCDVLPVQVQTRASCLFVCMGVQMWVQSACLCTQLYVCVYVFAARPQYKRGHRKTASYGTILDIPKIVVTGTGLEQAGSGQAGLSPRCPGWLLLLTVADYRLPIRAGRTCSCGMPPTVAVNPGHTSMENLTQAAALII